MAEKKDPGKFTVRFNTSDPHQRTVVELLNRQGRYKAQFLTNAILHYIHCSQTPDIHGAPTISGEEIERIVCNILARQQAASAPQQEIGSAAMPQEVSAGQPEDTDKDVVFKTLEAFRQQ